MTLIDVELQKLGPSLLLISYFTVCSHCHFDTIVTVMQGCGKRVSNYPPLSTPPRPSLHFPAAPNYSAFLPIIQRRPQLLLQSLLFYIRPNRFLYA